MAQASRMAIKSRSQIQSNIHLTPSQRLQSAVRLSPSSKLQPSPSQRQQQLSTVAVPTTQESEEGGKKQRKRRRVKRKKKEDSRLEVNFDIPGVEVIVMSLTTQKAVKCIVGEDVTGENPWKYIPKELFEDNLELYEFESEFLPIKEEILTFPGNQFLVGFKPEINREYDEFYICLTESAEKKASDVIELIEKYQEDRLNNSVYKKVYPWRTRGSEKEVDGLIAKNNRPLLEVEVETQYPVISPVSRFRLRLVEHAKDGYAELIAGRYQYLNTFKVTIDSAVQVTPTVRLNEVQTICTYPQNACTQYEYEYEPILEFSKELQQSVTSFIKQRMDHVEDMIHVSGSINFYKNDYVDLVRDDRFARNFEFMLAKEYTSLIDILLCKDKTISAVSWHPLWSGTIGIAYTDEAPNLSRKQKPNTDEVLKAIYNVAPVLMWSFTDTLHPKLLFETPREVTTISFCPFEDNLLIGGCTNGQIIIWDFKNKLENVEMEEILTAAQQRYRTLMNSLMSWMKNTKDLKIVRYTAVSDVKYSHTSPVAGIKWLSPFREVTKSGQIKDIPDEENRTSMQFMTVSRDGTILCWDLKSHASADLDMARSRKLRRLKQCPEALVTDVSPLKSLNRIFKPTFKVNILAPGTSRNLPLSSFHIKFTLCRYEEINPDPNRKFNITERIYYKPVLMKPIHPLVNEVAAGTVEGDFVIASWEGFSFNSGEVVNKESAKLENFCKFHDGPVVVLARSDICNDLILTVGGKIFALWKKELPNKPIFWRRSQHRYTHGTWTIQRPSMFRLARDDGYMEIWHLKTRSDRYEEIIPISSGAVIGSYGHPRPMKQTILAAADYNGSLRLFYISPHLSQLNELDNEKVLHICEREAARKLGIMRWQEEWTIRHAERIRLNKERAQKAQEEKEQERKKKLELHEQEEQQRAKEEAMRQAFLEKPEPGRFKEWAERQWRVKQEQQMNRVLLQKKALDIEFLEKQQVPLTKVIAEEHMKKKKQERRLQNANKIFNNTVLTLFPDVAERRGPPPSDPYGGGDPMEVKLALYENYLETVKHAEEFVNKRKYVYGFDWHRFLQEGEERRKVLDGFYKRPNHKNRHLFEKSQQKNDKFEKYFMAAQQHKPEQVDKRDSQDKLTDEALDEFS